MSANDFCTAINRLRTQPQLGSAVASSVLLGVSSFFRDTAVYEQLGREVLPGALNRLDGSLRVLSAGCSEGQELYSIAMLLADLGALNKSFLLGMDCRQEALKRAAQGVYPATAIEDVPKTFRGFFEVQGKTVKVKAEIAAPLHWWKADVVDFPPQCTWDLILYRNVAIYLENSPAMEAWQRLMDCLNPGGVLVTGKAERPPDAFALERLGPCIYRKVRDQ